MVNRDDMLEHSPGTASFAPRGTSCRPMDDPRAREVRGKDQREGAGDARQGEARSEELVSESHIVAEAVEEANTLVRNAERDADRIRLEAGGLRRAASRRSGDGSR